MNDSTTKKPLKSVKQIYCTTEQIMDLEES